MKIQLLTFPDCPNAAKARDALREAMTAEGVAAAVSLRRGCTFAVEHA